MSHQNSNKFLIWTYRQKKERFVIITLSTKTRRLQICECKVFMKKTPSFSSSIIMFSVSLPKCFKLWLGYHSSGGANCIKSVVLWRVAWGWVGMIICVICPLYPTDAHALTLVLSFDTIRKKCYWKTRSSFE